jgi:hypothetical protein
VTAVPKVKLYSGLEVALYVVVNVVRNLAPYLHAADFYDYRLHAFIPYPKATTV